MNKIDFGEQIVLENNEEYVCYATINDNNNDYIYLINVKNNKDVKIARQILNNNEIEIEIIEDSEKLKHINNLFNKKYKK